MEYMLDTNALIHVTTDHESLDRNVAAIVQDYDNTFCVSTESIKELIIAYKNKGFKIRGWKTADEMVESITANYGIRIIPVDRNVLRTYAKLTTNDAQGHKDPSDHIIISHAMTLGVPLISSDLRFPYYTKQGLKLIFNKK